MTMEIQYIYKPSFEIKDEIKELLNLPYEIASIELLIEFKIHGRYIPATHWEPEEYPELELIKLITTSIEDTDGLYHTIDLETSNKLVDIYDMDILELPCWKYINSLGGEDYD